MASSRARRWAGQTTSYVYDTLGNLTQVTLPSGSVITYTVDGRGRRVGKSIDGVLVKAWLYGDQLRPIAELDGTGAVMSRFVYGTRVNVPEYIIKDGQTYRVFSDHLGSPRIIVEATTGAVVHRMDFGPFGEVQQNTNPGWHPFGFAGGLYDADTGLVRFGARDYDARTGRWTAKDPIGFGAGDPNLFGYVSANPVDSIDPSGLYTVDEFLADLANVSAGFGDTLTSGFGLSDESLTQMIRQELGIDIVDECSIGYMAGTLSAYAWATAGGGQALWSGVQRGGWLNANRYLRVGFGRLKNRRVFRISGDLISKIKQSGHIDIWKGGPLGK
jgi:RHS repeat-associated protein